MSTNRPTSDAARYTQLLLIAASMFSLFSFLLAMLPYQNWGFAAMLAAQPGRFLFRSFHYAGVVVPMMLYTASLAVSAPRFRLDWIGMVVLSPLPMGSAAISFRIWFSADIAASPGTAAAVAVFGEAVASGVAAVGTVVLGLVVMRIGKFLPPHTVVQWREPDDTPDVSEDTAGGFELTSEVPGDQSDQDPLNVVDTRDPEDDGRPSGLMQTGPLSSDAFNRLVLSGTRAAEVPKENPEVPHEEFPEQQLDEQSESPVIRVSFPRPDRRLQDEQLDEYRDEHPDEETDDQMNDWALLEDVETVDDAEAADEIDDREEEAEERERDARILAESPPPKRITRGRYSVPVDGLLDHYENHAVGVIGDETRAAAQALKETLQEFNIEAEVTGIRKGPVITMFEILPAPGVKLTKISSLADNIALRLAAQSVRIVAPIPGKHAVGIEIPNQTRSLVSFGELLHDKQFSRDDAAIPLAIGRDIPGDAQIVDLTRTPHLLIAGATGSGKSVCVNSIICSILYRRAPEEVRLILIDPKIVELKFYNDIPHLLTPVITDPKRAFQALQYAIYEMERRYSLLDAMGVRDISSYNRKIKERKLATSSLPYIVIIVDEFADLMATSGKELESTVARLCAMSRAVGIHLVLATQRPSTDVITGLIKANIPSRIAFMVASKVDSRIIIDTGGAEKLLGRGDMLFTSAWDPFPFRMQGAFLSEEEVERVVSHVKTLGEPDYIDDEIFIDDEDADYAQPELEDPLMEKAIDIVVTANKASASYLQRRLKIGYNRAARLVEEMERVGIVGPQNGSKARDVIGSPE